MRSGGTSTITRRVMGLLVALLVVFRLTVACDAAMAVEAAPIPIERAMADCAHPTKPTSQVPAAKPSCVGTCPVAVPALAAGIDRGWSAAELHEAPEAAAADREIRPLVPPPQGVPRYA